MLATLFDSTFPTTSTPNDVWNASHENARTLRYKGIKPGKHQHQATAATVTTVACGARFRTVVKWQSSSWPPQARSGEAVNSFMTFRFGIDSKCAQFKLYIWEVLCRVTGRKYDAIEWSSVGRVVVSRFKFFFFYFVLPGKSFHALFLGIFFLLLVSFTPALISIHLLFISVSRIAHGALQKKTEYTLNDPSRGSRYISRKQRKRSLSGSAQISVAKKICIIVLMVSVIYQTPVCCYCRCWFSAVVWRTQ